MIEVLLSILACDAKSKTKNMYSALALNIDIQYWLKYLFNTHAYIHGIQAEVTNPHCLTSDGMILIELDIGRYVRMAHTKHTRARDLNKKQQFAFINNKMIKYDM